MYSLKTLVIPVLLQYPLVSSVTWLENPRTEWIMIIARKITDFYGPFSIAGPLALDLGTGSDPTFSIDELAKKKKKYPTDKVGWLICWFITLCDTRSIP